MDLHEILRKINAKFPSEEFFAAKSGDDQKAVVVDYYTEKIILLVEHYENQLRVKDFSNKKLMCDAYNAGVMSTVLHKDEINLITKDPILTDIILKKVEAVKDKNFNGLANQFIKEAKEATQPPCACAACLGGEGFCEKGVKSNNGQISNGEEKAKSQLII